MGLKRQNKEVMPVNTYFWLTDTRKATIGDASFQKDKVNFEKGIDSSDSDKIDQSEQDRSASSKSDHLTGTSLCYVQFTFIVIILDINLY